MTPHDYEPQVCASPMTSGSAGAETTCQKMQLGGRQLVFWWARVFSGETGTTTMHSHAFGMIQRLAIGISIGLVDLPCHS